MNDTTSFSQPSISDLKKFEKFAKRIKLKVNEITDPAEQYILEQLHLFLGWSLVIKAVQCKDENENLVPPQENSLYHRAMVGPTVRLIIESLIKVSYIYCAPNDEIKKERLNKLTDTLAIEYRKFLKYLSNRPEHFSHLLDGIPEAPDTTDMKKISVWQMVDEIEKDKQSFPLYGMFRIACFYAHGNIDNVLWKKLFKGENPKQPSLETYPLLFVIAASHLIIAKNLWGKRFPDVFDGLNLNNYITI